MSEGDIVFLILQRIKERLEADMITAIEPKDPTRLYDVKIGRFQEDKVEYARYAAISSGSLLDPEFMDGVVTIRSMERIGISVPPREIGGGERWYRRGMVQLGCYWIENPPKALTGLSQEETMALYSYTIMGRLNSSLRRTRVADLVDEFDERAKELFVASRSFFQTGGPPDQYIWTGSVHWTVLTSLP